MGSIFYSLEAMQGGGIYVNGNVTIRYCSFANNTAENSQGNDVYVASSSSSFYNNPSNIQFTCSHSLPGRLVTSGGVCVLLFDKIKLFIMK
jgi:hypothetical protein